MLGYADPDTPPHYLPPDVDDVILGQTLRLALKASKKVSVEEFQKIFHSGIVQRLAKDREVWAMEHYGYKTKRAMYKNMMGCSIEILEGKIEIQPNHHKGMGNFTGISNDGSEILHLPATCTYAELGAALREGFRRCTSSVK